MTSTPGSVQSGSGYQLVLRTGTPPPEKEKEAKSDKSDLTGTIGAIGERIFSENTEEMKTDTDYIKANIRVLRRALESINEENFQSMYESVVDNGWRILCKSMRLPSKVSEFGSAVATKLDALSKVSDQSAKLIQRTEILKEWKEKMQEWQKQKSDLNSDLRNLERQLDQKVLEYRLLKIEKDYQENQKMFQFGQKTVDMEIQKESEKLEKIQEEIAKLNQQNAKNVPSKMSDDQQVGESAELIPLTESKKELEKQKQELEETITQLRRVKEINLQGYQQVEEDLNETRKNIQRENPVSIEEQN